MSARRDRTSSAPIGRPHTAAAARYGEGFADLLGSCKVWVNGEPADDGDAVAADDEVAVLPPVSGG